MGKSRTFRKRKGFDEIERFAMGIFLRLSANQVAALERLAEAAGKSLKVYLRDLGEAMIEQMIPAEK